MGGPVTLGSISNPTINSLIGTLSMQPGFCHFYSGDPIWHEEWQDGPHVHAPSYTDLQYLPLLGHWQLVNENFGTYTGGSLASPVGSYTGGSGITSIVVS